MSLSPITNVPITWQNSVVDIVPTSRYGKETDFASINTVICLQNPQEEKVTFVLPSLPGQEQKPLLRLEGQEEVIEMKPLPEGVATPEVQELLTEAQEDQKKLAKRIVELAKHANKMTVAVPKGIQLVHFHYRVPVKKIDDNTFEFIIMAPLASFILASGGDMSIVVAIPRVPGANTVLGECISLPIKPGDPTIEAEKPAPVAQHQLVGWYWKNDPLLKVTYSYQ